MKFKKKQIVIEAFQMTKKRRTDNSEWPEWLHRAWRLNHDSEGSLSPVDYPKSDGTDQLRIRTLEGMYLVGFDDWIIKGVKGEIYPCKPDIFSLAYDPVEEKS